jgi:hypothetical protein
MAAIAKIGRVINPALSAGYIFFLPGMQGTSEATVLDRSGLGNNLAAGSAQSAAELSNTVAGRFSSLASANKHPAVAASSTALGAWVWGAAEKNSLFFSTRFKVTLAAQPLLGMAVTPGWKCNVAVDGSMTMSVYDDASHSVFPGAAAGSISDGVETTLGIFFDGVANTVQIYIGGVLKSTVQSLATLTGNVGAAKAFTFGEYLPGGTGVAASFCGAHLLRAPSSAGQFLYPEQLAKRLHWSPITPVAPSEWLL